MKEYLELKTGDFVKIPAGTDIFLISSQLSVIVKNTEIIRIDAICWSNTWGEGYVFGYLQTIIFQNFHDRPHCEISFEYNKAIDLESEDYPPPFPYIYEVVHK